MKKILRNFVAMTFCLLPAAAFGASGEFDLDRWYSLLHDIQNRSVEMKISNHTINEVIQPSAFIPSIVKNDRNQLEFKLTLDQYLSQMVNKSRIENGKKMAKTYPTLLSRVEQQFGIQPHVILAFWGMESNYGTYKAKYKLSDAFLTLIYEGRRETFFTNQLFALMRIADKNKLEISDIYGSWAGAMGHFQFIPTTLEQYGRDGNADGKIDIVNSVGDAMFSAGNYLSKLGWNKNERIVREVRVPIDFDLSLLDGKTKKTLDEWRAMDIVNPNGTPIPSGAMIAGLLADVPAPVTTTETELSDPNDPNSPTITREVTVQPPVTRAYLTYPNFYRIKKWNNSNWYAIAIAELADKIKN